MRRSLIIGLIFNLIFIPVSLAAPKAMLDRTQITEGETVQLVIEGDEGEPDLSPLEALFDVLGTSTSSQVNIINGRMTSNKRWIVSLSPKQTGTLVIPSITMGGQKTARLQLVVDAAGTRASTQNGNPVFVEVNADPKQAYVQSQVIYTVKLYHAADIRDGGLSQPTIDNVVTERLGEDKNYQSQVGGQLYQVTERRYALFPQASGDMTIPPMVFSGQIVDMRSMMNNRGLDPFNRFFNQPTFRPIRLRSKSITIQVKPKPAEAGNGAWLPSRKLDLTETWSEKLDQLKPGEPVTRTIRIEAVGLTGAQLPEINIVEHPAYKQYPDQARVENLDGGDSLIGLREQKIAIVPNQDGLITLPEIKLEWWNTQKNKKEVALIPARQLKVQAPQVKPSGADNSKSGGELPAIQPRLSAAKQQTLPIAGGVSEIWVWVSLINLIGWLTTAWLWWRSRAIGIPSTVTSNNGKIVDATNPAQKKAAIKVACLENSPAKTRNALIAWSQANWPEVAPSNLHQIKSCLESDRAKALLDELDQVLYARGEQRWDGHRFWDEIAPSLKMPMSEYRENLPKLPQLYPV
ncbi:MAG: BatD family protein [Gammaproteobacteria bacterium]|nr:BatD family protein [Gammaproteobacteria bacterium]